MQFFAARGGDGRTDDGVAPNWEHGVISKGLAAVARAAANGQIAGSRLLFSRDRMFCGRHRRRTTNNPACRLVDNNINGGRAFCYLVHYFLITYIRREATLLEIIASSSPTFGSALLREYASENASTCTCFDE